NAVIARRCAEVGVVPRTLETAKWNGQRPAVDFINIDGWSGKEYFLGLLGEHQVENAALAVLVANTLKKLLPITDEDIRQGLRNATHPGRLEWVEHANVRVLLDGAHNRSGAEALASYLSSNLPDANVALVYGTVKDKDYESILRILSPFAADVILTEPRNSRSASAAAIARSNVLLQSKKRVFVISDVAKALGAAVEKARKYSGGTPAFILVTGSLYLVGDVKRIINKTRDNL
ncbi:MAG TPA: cyanophycin synthetase, partial [Pyrinomonadaceae bacterium]|nr:cyanophycin synthetase [Pyrinomonadaceae bacterium]